MLVVVGYLLALTVAGAFVQAPVVVVFRYYWLLLLGDLDPGLDMVPEARAAVREDENDEGDDGAGDGADGSDGAAV